MKKGILIVIAFYALGLGLTWLTYEVFGAGYKHGPGPYILVPFLSLLIGLFWTGSTIFNYYFKKKTAQRKGVIYANSVVLIIFIGAIFYVRESSKLPEIDMNDDLSTQHSGDSSSILYNGATIYLRIKDSVYVDKRDSITGTLK
jgi:hypothetical protein